MRYKVSKLSKAGIAREITTIIANRFDVGEPVGHTHIFDPSAGIAFYSNVTGWFGWTTDERLTAFLPGTDWIVETI